MAIDIAIITPIAVEYKAVRSYLQKLKTTESIATQSIYEVGKFKGKHQKFNILLCQSGSKNEELSLATDRIVRDFNPKILLVVGIAGGIKDVAIGDVVVGTKGYGYEAGKETPDGFVARPEAIHYNHSLKELAQIITAKDKWRNRCTTATKTNVFFGPIASGNKVIASTQSPTYKRLITHFNDTLAIEMEAIGFAKAMLAYPEIKIINIRGISDLLDNKAASDREGHQAIAAHHAAAFTFELIYRLKKNHMKKTMPNSDKTADSIHVNQGDNILTKNKIDNKGTFHVGNITNT